MTCREADLTSHKGGHEQIFRDFATEPSSLRSTLRKNTDKQAQTMRLDVLVIKAFYMTTSNQETTTNDCNLQRTFSDFGPWPEKKISRVKSAQKGQRENGLTPKIFAYQRVPSPP